MSSVRTTVKVEVLDDNGNVTATLEHHVRGITAGMSDHGGYSTDVTGTYRKALELASAHVDTMLVGGYGEAHAVRQAANAGAIAHILSSDRVTHHTLDGRCCTKPTEA